MINYVQFRSAGSIFKWALFKVIWFVFRTKRDSVRKTKDELRQTYSQNDWWKIHYNQYWTEAATHMKCQWTRDIWMHDV